VDSHLTTYGSSPSVATTLTFNGLDPDGVTSPRTKAPSSSVRGMRMMWDDGMACIGGQDPAAWTGGRLAV
jgi:hypothetical protein